MPETPSTPAAPIFGEHLIRAASKTLPIVGDVIMEMTLNVAKDIKDAESKKRLFASLEEINQRQQAHDTDIGDLLLQVQQNTELTQSVHDALADIIALVKPTNLALIIDDIPLARKRVNASLEMDVQISKLLNFVDSVEGDGRNNLLAVIVRRYPRFKINP